MTPDIEQHQAKERPILFSAAMVRAILEGRKTQTRRALNPQPEGGIQFGAIAAPHGVVNGKGKYLECKFGRPRDRLWVREAHAFVPEPAYRRSVGIYQQINPSDVYQACVYRENFDRSCSFPWRPSIHMPRWASRITLEITSVRVERLQDISKDDAKAEGVGALGPQENVWTRSDGGKRHYRERGFASEAQCLFHDLWQSINGPDSWDANPWVWVVEFRRIES